MWNMVVRYTHTHTHTHTHANFEDRQTDTKRQTEID